MRLLFALAIFTNIVNTLGLYWLTRRVNRNQHPLRIIVRQAELDSTLTDFQKGIKDFAKW